MEIRELRQEMSPDSRRVILIGHQSNKYRRVLSHHLRVHLHVRTIVSTMVRIPDLNLHIHRVVWHNGVVSFLPTPSVVVTTPVFFVRATLVVLCAVRSCISWGSAQRTSKEVLMGAIEKILHKLLHQTRLDLGELLQL